MEAVEDLAWETFNKELVRELLGVYGHEATDALVDEVWAIKEDNPWDAVVIYTLVQLASKINIPIA